VVAPTVEEIQSWTKLALLKEQTPEDAARTLKRALGLLKKFTGIDQAFMAQVGAEDESEIERAIQGLAELLSVQESEERLETLADWDLIQSFSAGNYSETRRSPKDAKEAHMLVPWPELNTLLWGLMTDDARDYWFAFFGVPVPAWDVQEVDWSRGPAFFSSDPSYWGGA
jgi:hypothetical protein